MSVTYEPNQQVVLTGQLWGSNVAGQTIQFGGAVSGTTTTDGSGQYSATLKPSQLGQVTATEANGQSMTATATLTSQVPTITNFDAICLDGGVWQITGTVQGAPTQGEVVTLGGIPALNGQTVNVSPGGGFTLFITVNPGNGGCATAQAVDWWGDTSTVATTSVPA